MKPVIDAARALMDEVERILGPDCWDAPLLASWEFKALRAALREHDERAAGEDTTSEENQ